jgi:2-dehydro-3-deoxygluconokinase
VILEGMQAAKAQGAIVSFDLNYRGKLWASAGGPERAKQVLGRIAGHVDALIGNEEDLQKGLGIAGPEVTDTSKSKLDPETFFEMIGRVVQKYPNIKLVATTLREVHSTNRHDWAAVLWLNGETFKTPHLKLDVLDRIGGGDGFASGLIYGLMSGREPQDALELGWAHGALLTTYAGDVTMARLSEVESLAKGGSARVDR